MMISNANYATLGGQGGGGGGAGGGMEAHTEWETDAFGRVVQYGRTYNELPNTPPMTVPAFTPILLPHHHVPHPSFTTSILGSAASAHHSARPITPTNAFFPPPSHLTRSPLTPPTTNLIKRPSGLINQITAALSDILWAGDQATLDRVLDHLEGLDAGVGRDVRSSLKRAHEEGKLVEYVRGLMRLVQVGVEGRGCFTYLAWEVEKLIVPIESIIDELLRLRGSAIISTFPMLAAVRYVESNALGLSLDIREISMNREVSHDNKIRALRDTVAELRSRVEHYYEDLLITHSATSPPLLSHPQLPSTGNTLGLDHVGGPGEELAFDEQVGSLFKMLSSNSIQHVEHAGRRGTTEEVGVDGDVLKAGDRREASADREREDVDVDVHTGHTTSSEGDEEEEDGEEETVVNKQ